MRKMRRAAGDGQTIRAFFEARKVEFLELLGKVPLAVLKVDEMLEQ